MKDDGTQLYLSDNDPILAGGGGGGGGVGVDVVRMRVEVGYIASLALCQGHMD